MVYFCCGDRGHLARSCHNAVVCFACNRLGHRSHTCKAITMLPSSSRPPLTREMKSIRGSLPPMRFSCTQSIRDFDETLRQGVVIKDHYRKGAPFIHTRLSERFPVDNFTWRVVPLTDDCFLLYPPDPTWKAIALKESKILLGDIIFPLEAFDPSVYDGGWEPIPFWVKIYGLPSSLLHGSEFDRLISEIGGIVLQVDPLSRDRDNLKSLCLEIGVSARSDIPPCRKLLFTGPDGVPRYYWIQFVVKGAGRPPPENTRSY